jgi:Glycosyl hydrolase family 47
VPSHCLHSIYFIWLSQEPQPSPASLASLYPNSIIIPEISNTSVFYTISFFFCSISTVIVKRPHLIDIVHLPQELQTFSVRFFLILAHSRHQWSVYPFPRPTEPEETMSPQSSQRLRYLILAFIVIYVYYNVLDFSSQTGASARIRPLLPPQMFPAESLTPLPKGRAKTIPKIQAEFPPPRSESNKGRKIRDDRLTAVRESFKHAWDGYHDNALGHDELAPISGETKDPFSGWAATLVDALDSMWIMGLKKEFEQALDALKVIQFTDALGSEINLFETTIRYLGGLLGAYEVSGRKYKVLLDKATELGEFLYGAFDTPNRMPMTRWKWEP